MGAFGERALPGYLGLVHLTLAIYVGARLVGWRLKAPGEVHFHPMLRTTPTAMELLPETPSPSASSSEST
jgi:hypothetical protein